MWTRAAPPRFAERHGMPQKNCTRPETPGQVVLLVLVTLSTPRANALTARSPLFFQARGRPATDRRPAHE